MEAPALDFRALAGVRLCDLRHLAHGSRRFVLPTTNPARDCWRRNVRKNRAESGALERAGGVQAAHQFLEPRLDHRALRVGVRAELLDSPADLGFELHHSPVECREPLVALALQRFRRFCEACFETLCTGVADVCKTLGENALRLARKDLDR